MGKAVWLLGLMVVAAALGGCQSVANQPWPGQCSARPFDAGFCDQPTNFRLFDYLAGVR